MDCHGVCHCLLITWGEIRQTYGFLIELYVDVALIWCKNIDFMCNKVQYCVYFIRRVRSFEASTRFVSIFQSLIQSVMQYGIAVSLSNLKLSC